MSKSKLKMLYLDFKLYKRVRVHGSIFVTIFYNLFNDIYWLTILFLVLYNRGHISETKSFKSATDLKIKESVFTNFTEEDFEPNLFKPELLKQYNRIWDSEDYSNSEPEEIQVITNLVITPNQTRSKCPGNPFLYGVLCDNNPDNNHCEKGKMTKHGILTGMCVPCYIKYHVHINDRWKDRYCCEIEESWCPVEYLLPPLKKYAPVLNNTKNSNLWLTNIVQFNEYDITLDNQIDPNLTYYLKCKYDPQIDPNCPIFKLENILKLSKHNKQDYDTMAKFGAHININISYGCFFPFWSQIFSLRFVPNIPFISVRTFNQRIDCQTKYEFSRIDNNTQPPTGYTTYRQVFLYNQGNSRTHWRTWRLRITVDVNASIGYYNLFKFLTIFFAYFGLYQLLKYIFCMFVRRLLRNHDDKQMFEETIVYKKPNVKHNESVIEETNEAVIDMDQDTRFSNESGISISSNSETTLEEETQPSDLSNGIELDNQLITYL